MPPSLSWSDTDACLALDESLSDPDLTEAQRNDLIRQVVSLCLVSPKAFQRLSLYGKTLVSDRDSVSRALQATAHHPKGAAFRAWLETHGDVPRSGEPEPFLTASQKRAWQALEETSALYYSGALQGASIQPRTARLIAGPSGNGKSHLLRTFAKAKGYGFLSLTFGQWIPKGARADETTDVTIARFLMRHERCVIAIDELDKFHRELRLEWSVSIQNELFALLDRTLFDTRGDDVKRELLDKLRYRTFLVGSGTWQSLWAVNGGARPTIGFSPGSNERSMPSQIRAAREIPTELLNRFHPEILLLEPLRAGEFAQICESTGLTALATTLGAPLDFGEAEASGLGMRWVEAQTLNLHLRKARQSATNLQEQRI